MANTAAFKIFSKYRSIFSLNACVLLMVACSSDGDNERYSDRPVDTLYGQAKTLLEAGEFKKSAEAFADVERQHPYSNWALRAQIMSSYSYYQARKYDEAIDGFQIFIQLHPGHDDVPYAYYMIGLCYYEQIPIVQRDQEPAQKAEDAFNEVINRFPHSKYAKDARFKLDLIRDHLASKEMYIGRCYQKKGSLIAAMNRFKTVVEKYATTAQAPEALYRLVEVYSALGLKDDAKNTAAVLGHNYRESTWYKDAYELLKLPMPLIQPKAKTQKIEEIEDSITDKEALNANIPDELKPESRGFQVPEEKPQKA